MFLRDYHFTTFWSTFQFQAICTSKCKIMETNIDKSTGLKNLKTVLEERPEKSSHWNEAQNRFHFIDELIVKCLGWKKSNINVEVRGDGGITDYELGALPYAILEAKKETLQFSFPPKAGVEKTTKLRNIYDFCSNAKSAIDQVIDYSTRRGVPLAIVCNGPQMIIFQTIVSGQSLYDMECRYFDGLKDYQNNFSKLWDFLSPEGLQESVALSALNVTKSSAIPLRPSSSIANIREVKHRNNFQENLNSICQMLLQSIANHEEVKSDFYKNCYVNLEANNRHLLLSKNIIENRYSRATAPNKPNAIREKIRTKSDNSGRFEVDHHVLMESITTEPVVVLGDVGVGKTSFFENMYQDAFGGKSEEVYFLTIDLGSEANLSDDLKIHTIESVFSQLRQKYNIDVYEDTFVRSIYHDEIERFSTGIFSKLRKAGGTYERELVSHLAQLTSNNANHLHATLAHLAKGRNKTIIIIIDNADQRTFDIQQKAFLIAKEIASKRCSIVFIALRPSTFYLSKTTGALSGYKSKFFTISPPPADQVIEKRLVYALRVITGRIKLKALRNISLPFSDTKNFLTLLLRSIRDDEKIKVFLNNITGGNMRAVIELVADFCGSPHINSQKAVDAEKVSGNYKMPLHQIAKHALLRDYKYFNPESSFVSMNLFDVDFPDPRNHFLCGMVILPYFKGIDK